MNQPSDSDALALARHAAATWIQEALKQNFTLARATARVSERTWGGQSYSASTLESWYYLWRHHGFDALQRQPRKGKGSRKALSPEACQALLEWRQQYPQLTIQVLVRQLIEQGTLQAGTFSLPSVYRFLAAHHLDARFLKHHPPSPQRGPTKAFECALANQLWMTDMMFGPTLKRAGGPVIQTRLFALLDDCSRLIPHAQYYDSEKLCWFLDCFRQGLARRGFPEKLYTDQGKIFTSYHLQIVCPTIGHAGRFPTMPGSSKGECGARSLGGLPALAIGHVPDVPENLLIRQLPLSRGGAILPSVNESPDNPVPARGTSTPSAHAHVRRTQT